MLQIFFCNIKELSRREKGTAGPQALEPAWINEHLSFLFQYKSGHSTPQMKLRRGHVSFPELRISAQNHLNLR